MSVYDRDGTPVAYVYGIDGNVLPYVYDVEGDLIMTSKQFKDKADVFDIYTASITSQPQGGCIDDDGNIYICCYSAGKFVKYNIQTQTETLVSFTPNAYGHANGMTYNPNTEHIYIASMKDTGEVYELDKSFSLVDTHYFRNGSGNILTCYNLAYDRTSSRFMSIQGGYLYLLDDDFTFDKSLPISQENWSDSRQDIECEGEYIYCVSWATNLICVFTKDGIFVKAVDCTDFTGEPESVMYDHVNDVFYLEGKDTNVVIRQIDIVQEASS